MSNTASDSLHKLIHCMTKAEKRYFKVFCSRHIIGDDTFYEILFDAIDRQKEYDETKIIAKFKGKPFVQRFSISKNRLYAAVLKSLDSFHAQGSVLSQLRRQLHTAEILYYKSLYEQSSKILASIRKTAEKHEIHSVLLEVSAWERKIQEKDNYENLTDDDDLERMQKRDLDLVENIKKSVSLWNIKSRLFLQLFRFGKARSEEEQLRFQTLVEEADALLPLSGVESQYLYHHIKSAYFFSIGDYFSSDIHLQELLSCFEKNPEIFEEDPTIYLSTISNSIYTGMRTGKQQRAKEDYRKLVSFCALLQEQHCNEDLRIRIFKTLSSTQITMCIQTASFEEAKTFISQIKEGLDLYENQLSRIRLAHIYQGLAVIYFGMEEFKESLKWINKLLNQVDIDKTRDVHCIAQILHMIIHLELGNLDVIPYALRSAERFLSTRKKTFAFEELMLEFLGEVLKKRPQLQGRELYKNLILRLEKLKEDPQEKVVFEHFDFLAWARSKYEGTTYRKILAA